MRLARLTLPVFLIGALAACVPYGGGAPVGLQSTSVSAQMSALQETQAALSYYATQTPYAATLAAQGTESAIAGIHQQTQIALDTQGTALALQLLADQATQTQIAVSTQSAYSLQATQRADQATQTAFEGQLTATQDSRNATATQEALEYARKEQINGVIAWTPVVFVAGIMLLIWRFVIVVENKQSVFNTPSGEMVFTRKSGIFAAVLKTLIRRWLEEISFDEMVMPGRAVGHSVKEDKAGYKASQAPDRQAQLQVIMLEQLKTLPGYRPTLPGLPTPETPQLPPYAGLLGTGAGIEIVSPVEPEIGEWIADVEEEE